MIYFVTKENIKNILKKEYYNFQHKKCAFTHCKRYKNSMSIPKKIPLNRLYVFEMAQQLNYKWKLK